MHKNAGRKVKKHFDIGETGSLSMIDMMFGGFAALLGMMIVVVSFIEDAGRMVGSRRLVLDISVSCAEKEICSLQKAWISVLVKPIEDAYNCWSHLGGPRQKRLCHIEDVDCWTRYDDNKSELTNNHDKQEGCRQWDKEKNVKLIHRSSPQTTLDRQYDGLRHIIVMESDSLLSDFDNSQFIVLPILNLAPTSIGVFDTKIETISKNSSRVIYRKEWNNQDLVHLGNSECIKKVRRGGMFAELEKNTGSWALLCLTKNEMPWIVITGSGGIGGGIK